MTGDVDRAMEQPPVEQPPVEQPPVEQPPVLRSSRRTVKFVALGAAVVFAAFAAVMALQLDGESEYRGSRLLGQPVPALALPLLDGEGTFDLASQRGKVLFVNFFNSWCIPCQEEEPALQAFYAAHRADPRFEFLGIIRDDNDRAVRRWVEEKGVEWPVVSDPAAQASVDFATTGQPETYAISPSGVIVAVHLGRATLDDLENMLAIAEGRAPENASGPR